MKSIRYDGLPSFVHLDLHEFNLFADENRTTDILKVFDFGFALFMAPYVAHYGPLAFAGNEMEISRAYGILPDELSAFEIIFSLEFAVFLASIQFAPDEPYGYIVRKNEYIEKCKEYMDSSKGKALK